MPTPTAPVITDAGLAAALAANGLGLSLQITHGVLSPDAFTPTGTSTQTDKREVALVASGAKIGNQINITINWRAADYSGPAYNVGSIGFYAGDPLAGGILFAVISAPDRASPARGGSSVANYTQTYTLTLSGVPEGSVSVSIDPDATVAMAALSAHIAATNPHPQYVRKIGDTMTGPLVLPGNPAEALQAAPKQYVDTQRDTRVAKAGDTMTGPLVLPGNAVNPLEAVPLQQLASAAFHNILLALNGWVEIPLAGTNRALVLQWCRVYVGNPPGGAGGFLIPFSYPRPMDGFIGAVVSPIMGVSTAIRVAIEEPTLTSAKVRCEEWAAFSQNVTAQVFLLGYIGGDVPGELLPGTPAEPGPGEIVADFTMSLTTALVGQTITFTDTSTNSPTAWYWDFGDGNTSTLQNPTHDYAAAGAYTVSLTASKTGSSDTKVFTPVQINPET